MELVKRVLRSERWTASDTFVRDGPGRPCAPLAPAEVAALEARFTERGRERELHL